MSVVLALLQTYNEDISEAEIIQLIYIRFLIPFNNFTAKIFTSHYNITNVCFLLYRQKEQLFQKKKK